MKRRRRKVRPIPWTPTKAREWSPSECFLRRTVFVTLHVFRSPSGWTWRQLNGRGAPVAECLETFETSFAAILSFETYYSDRGSKYDSD